MTSKVSKKTEKLGQHRKLSKLQEVEVFDLITRRRPFQLGFKIPYRKSKRYLWTRDLVKQLIMKKYEVQLTDSGLVNYLSRWGFPKMNNKDSKLGVDKTTQDWLKLHLATTLGRGKEENANIIWLGHIALINLHPCIIEKLNKFTFIPIISKQGRLNWLTVRGNFTVAREVMFLKSLVGQSHKKIFLIRKTAKHFYRPLVMDWLNKNQDLIEIFPPPK